MSLTAAWVTALALEVTDPKGNHFPAGSLPEEGANAIVKVCTTQKFAPEDLCASTIVTMIARESGFSITIRGDSGRALGCLQLHFKELGLYEQTTWTGQIYAWAPWFEKSWRMNPKAPLAALACGNSKHPKCIAISDSRMLEAKRVLAAVAAKEKS